ncbi:MAG: glutamate-1-semialdehyde 2,1-aminomutase [Acidobacteriaceae bacterium]
MPANHRRSRHLQQRAEHFFPGGVNSPVRAFRAVGGGAPFLVRAEGAYLWDADGNRYLDYFCSWGPMILGHAAPHVVRAIQEAAARGASFGASTPAEADLAELVQRAFPSMEKMRFVNSGTEAAMSAIRVARAFTGRKFVIKFEGCYHGHADAMLVKAGSGVATFGIPGSAGVPEETVQHTLALPFNDIPALEATFASHKAQIACVIVEPVVGNAGCIPPTAGYLTALRSITQREGALLIFDEVMTGFRVALGGAQERYGILPDMTCLGKIIGGGLPCAAFGGRAEIMQLLAPLGPVYQAGTLSGNPLAMAAGIATVGHLIEHQSQIYAQLESTSAAVADGVAQAAREAGVPLCTHRVGSMFTWFFQPGPVTDYASAARSDVAAFASFHRAMLDQGVWLPPSQFEAAFLGTAHTAQEVAETLQAARIAFAAVAQGAHRPATPKPQA